MKSLKKTITKKCPFCGAKFTVIFRSKNKEWIKKYAGVRHCPYCGYDMVLV